MAKSGPAKDGTVVTLTDGVHAYMQDVQGGWGFNNTALVHSRGQTLLIDTTSDIPMNAKMLAAFRKAERRATRIDILFLTHWHVDHVHGACMDEFKDSRIICSEKCADWMADLPPKAWLAMVDSLTGEAKKEMDAHLGNYFDFSGLKPIVPTETFNGSTRFNVGDEHVEVFEGKMSHTRSDSLVHIPGKSFVHMGDITVPDSIQQLQYPGMKNLLEDFEVLIKWDAKYYLPGHGRMMTLDDLKVRVEHCLWLQDQVKRRYDKGMNLEAATDDLTRNLGPYKSWTNVAWLYWTVKMLYAEIRGDLDEYARRNYPTYLATSRRLKLEFPQKYPDLSVGKF